MGLERLELGFVPGLHLELLLLELADSPEKGLFALDYCLPGLGPVSHIERANPKPQ